MLHTTKEKERCRYIDFIFSIFVVIIIIIFFGFFLSFLKKNRLKLCVWFNLVSEATRDDEKVLPNSKKVSKNNEFPFFFNNIKKLTIFCSAFSSTSYSSLFYTQYSTVSIVYSEKIYEFCPKHHVFVYANFWKSLELCVGMCLYVCQIIKK